MSADPHVTSDNAAIEAAHRRVYETAQRRFATVCDHFLRRPSPLSYDDVLQAARSLLTQHYTRLEQRIAELEARDA